MSNSQAAVLIVAANAQLRVLLSAVLAQQGCRVRSAEDGFTALAAMRAEMPDVILSDLYMPGMSGFELLSVVRRRFPAVRAVAMSSAFSGDNVPPGIVADAYYEKASNLNSLLRIMNTLTYAQRPPAFRVSSTNAPLGRPKSAGHRPPEDDTDVIACPECLRTFPDNLDGSSPIHETGCIHCSSTIHYAIVDTLDPTPPRPN